jgi:hypothetical protein
MDFVVLFVIAFIVIVLIINPNNYFHALPIRPYRWRESKTMDYKTSSCSKSKSKASKFEPKILPPPAYENTPLLDDLTLASSKESSVTCSKAKSEVSLPEVHTGADYYYLNNPKETQVYHIFQNAYNFKEAQQECAKRASTLANPNQLKNAYDAGANWCNWGWSTDGDAYMPNHDPKCNKKTGLINAKKVDKSMKIGVNCYGVPTSA